MNERVNFIAQYLGRKNRSASSVGAPALVGSPGTEVERYRADGVSALADRSRAPGSHPHEVSAAVIAMIVAIREKHRDGDRGSYSVQTGNIRHPIRMTWATSTIMDAFSRCVRRRQGLARASVEAVQPVFGMPFHECESPGRVIGRLSAFRSTRGLTARSPT